MSTIAGAWPNGLYGGGGIRLDKDCSLARRVARAENYRANIESRQVALPEDSLIAFSPYRIVRLARVQCREKSGWKVASHAFRNDLKRKIRDHECARPHRVGTRIWGVCGCQGHPDSPPLIMEWFNDILMARVLRDDLNLKAATAIMARQR